MTKSTFKTEVKCIKCGARWLWGLESGDRENFVCPKCLGKDKKTLREIQAEFEVIGAVLDYAQAKGLKKVNVKELSKWYCGECGEIREDDPRVEAGMKCGRCSYGY